jgi:hypothetical protein
MDGPYMHQLNPVQLPLLGEALHQSESWLHGEPSIQEVMSDPIVHLIMRRDGLTPESVWAVIEAASMKLQLKPKEVALIGGKGELRFGPYAHKQSVPSRGNGHCARDP